MRDFASLGELPVVLSSMEAARKTDAAKAKEIEWGIQFAAVALLRCAGPLQLEGESLIIVDKKFLDCSENEIALDEVDQLDANAIVEAVTELSSMTKEAADSAKPFPAE